MGRIPRGSGAARRWVALVVAVVCALGGCTYAQEEPGLFPRRPTPRPSAVQTSAPSQVAAATNDELPVIGETTWTSADGLGVQVRIAIHAVRRMEGATVLDWSVTPLRAPGLDDGDTVPPAVNLGLSRFGEGNTNVFLLDPDDRLVYRPLTHADPAALQHCLCSPLWLVQRWLRIGRTTLLQVTYPPLPATLRAVDVDVASVPTFWHVPVTPVGRVPLATSPVDLSAPFDTSRPVARSEVFVLHRQRFRIGVDAVLAADSFTALRWTISSVSDGDGLELRTGPPISDPDPDRADVYNALSASGPRIHVGATVLAPRRATTRLLGLGRTECLCSDLRLWASSLRKGGHDASVVTLLPPLPRGTTAVAVELPGLTTLRDVLVTAASDGSTRVAGPVAGSPKTWVYSLSEPPRGWTVDRWPTPLPRASQLRSYVATVDDLVD